MQAQQSYVVELLGRYRRTLEPGIHPLIPFIESVRAKVNMREQVASFPPQPAITSDNLVACIGTVLYYKVVDPVRATYEMADSVQAMEMSTITALRNLMGSMDLERARASSDEITLHLTEALDEKTPSWASRCSGWRSRRSRPALDWDVPDTHRERAQGAEISPDEPVQA